MGTDMKTDDEILTDYIKLQERPEEMNTPEGRKHVKDTLGFKYYILGVRFNELKEPAQKAIVDALNESIKWTKWE
jgi:hypothetical protein